jgi:hypothetical protein
MGTAACNSEGGEMKYCWCDMCGYNATVEPKDVATIEEQANCPLCDSENMFSILEIGPEIPEHVAEDDPMPVYPNLHPSDPSA